MPSILTWLAEDSMIPSDNATYHLAFVGPPYDCLVVHNVLGRSRARHDLAIRDIERVQNTHDGVLSGTRSLLFLQQFAMDVLTDERTKV